MLLVLEQSTYPHFEDFDGTDINTAGITLSERNMEYSFRFNDP
jgi:hypothetical protein